MLRHILGLGLRQCLGQDLPGSGLVLYLPEGLGGGANIALGLLDGASLEEAARADPAVQQLLEGKTVRKVIAVQAPRAPRRELLGEGPSPVPPALSAVVLRLMAKHAEERYQSTGRAPC